MSTVNGTVAHTQSQAWDLPRYRVKVDEYKHYQRNGYLIVRGLVEQPDVEIMRTWAMDLLYGRVTIPGVA